MDRVADGTAEQSPAGPCVVLCDLDGVIWLAHQPIPGSVEAIAALRAAGHRVLFVTNNSAARVEAQEASLLEIGIPAAGDVLTSASAAALLIEPGERVLVCGGEGVVQAVVGRGAVVVEHDAEHADVVVVGFHRTFDYDEMLHASRAVRNGARLVGTNDDATYPTPEGPIPGGGAILASIVTASGRTPIVAGKPHEPMAALVRTTVGDAASRLAVMVGDRPETDGLMASTLGCRYAHVESGVTAPGVRVVPVPDLTAPDLARVAKVLIAGGLPGGRIVS